MTTLPAPLLDIQLPAARKLDRSNLDQYLAGKRKHRTEIISCELGCEFGLEYRQEAKELTVVTTYGEVLAYMDVCCRSFTELMASEDIRPALRRLTGKRTQHRLQDLHFARRIHR